MLYIIESEQSTTTYIHEQMVLYMLNLKGLTNLTISHIEILYGKTFLYIGRNTHFLSYAVDFDTTAIQSSTSIKGKFDLSTNIS